MSFRRSPRRPPLDNLERATPPAQTEVKKDMSNVPEGAQLSDDGHWWWDGSQWQAVSQDGDAAGGSAGSAAPDAGAAGEAGADGGEGGREQARVAQGLPASLTELTDEQREQFMGEPEITSETLEYDEVEVLAMNDGHDENGEAIA
jgi:hypothetical protein